MQGSQWAIFAWNARNWHNLKVRSRNASHEQLIHQMPPEILSAIFQSSGMQDFIDQDFTFKSSKTLLSAPLILSSVYQKWRHIAHATPRLWTSLPFYRRPRNVHLLPQLAQEWTRIGRSGLRCGCACSCRTPAR
ncbi:hypothetical protein BDZ97DRAFT_290081 [Flammula alnicola]|nr:hypothetical protein BDZ97DRAFT_290081 [Flammula alnicola]